MIVWDIPCSPCLELPKFFDSKRILSWGEDLRLSNSGNRSKSGSRRWLEKKQTLEISWNILKSFEHLLTSSRTSLNSWTSQREGPAGMSLRFRNHSNSISFSMWISRWRKKIKESRRSKLRSLLTWCLALSSPRCFRHTSVWRLRSAWSTAALVRHCRDHEEPVPWDVLS